MRKPYIKPSTHTVSLQPINLLAASVRSYKAVGDYTPEGDEYYDTQY